MAGVVTAYSVRFQGEQRRGDVKAAREQLEGSSVGDLDLDLNSY
jgi:hypothetical protein